MRKAGSFLIIVSLLLGISKGLLAQYQLTGSVSYNNDNSLPIPEVTLGLYDLQDGLVVSAETDDNGNYFFNNIPRGEYYLRSTTSIAPNLVDMQDAYTVLMYLLDKTELDEVQFQAADIDNNGTVTWDDYSFIVSNYLINGEPFPAGAWQFEEVYIDYTSRDAPPDTSDLWGITEGDVEGIWEPSGRELSIPDYSYYPVQVANNEIQIDVNSNYNDQIAGFNINLAYPSNQLNIIDVSGPDGNLNYVVDEDNGIIRIVWLDENMTGRISGDKLITLTVDTKTADFNGSTFELLDGSMIIDSKGKEIKDVEIKLPMLEKNMDVELSVTAYPNPVVNQLHFNVNLNESNSASISVYNANGQLMSKTEQVSLQKGEQLITIDTQKYNAGYYFYVVELLGDTKYRTTGQFVKSH